jgi:hypothetical protein
MIFESKRFDELSRRTNNPFIIRLEDTSFFQNQFLILLEHNRSSRLLPRAT